MQKPWFREQTGQWYVEVYREIGGARRRKQIPLGPDEAEALKKWHTLQAQGGNPDEPDPTFKTLAELFLLHVERNLAPSTAKVYGRYLGQFCKRYGTQPTSTLKAYHLTKWLDESGFPPGARKNAIQAVKFCANWCVKQDLLKASPFVRVPTPKSQRREVVAGVVERRKILEVTDGPFRLFVTAIARTGCRPREVREVTAAMFDARAGVWVFPPRAHKTGKRTGKPRVVHLVPCLVTLNRILASDRPEGPLFLNADGKPWTHNAVRLRMRRLRKKLGLPKGTVAYSFRHGFITDGLAQGVSSKIMAELAGHENTAMIDAHYAHLDQHGQLLKDALAQFTSCTSPVSETAVRPPTANPGP